MLNSYQSFNLENILLKTNQVMTPEEHMPVLLHIGEMKMF